MNKITSLVIFVAFAIIIFIAYVIFSSFFEPGVYNLMVRNFVAGQKGSDGIVLVVIDDESIERHRWPWSRDLYAKIFDYLGHYTNAKIIGFDAVVTTPDVNNPKGDLELSVIKLSSKKTNIFVNYILDNFGFDGYSLIGQEGIKYTYTKFGTIESIIKTAYNGVDKFEVLNNFWQNYFISLFFKESVNNIFNILNIQ